LSFIKFLEDAMIASELSDKAMGEASWSGEFLVMR